MERLYREQQALRDCTAELVAIAGRDPPPDRATLALARWQVARTLLRHLPNKDRMVYARLRCHPDAGIAAIGERFRKEAHAMFDLFINHVERWTPDAIEANWATYRVMTRQSVYALDDRILREERELLPHLATAPDVAATRSDGDRNWAAEGWRLRTLLGIDGPAGDLAA